MARMAGAGGPFARNAAFEERGFTVELRDASGDSRAEWGAFPAGE
ncbi:MAG: hypothetical protein ACOCYR_03720 [Erythrobacter sp.]